MTRTIWHQHFALLLLAGAGCAQSDAQFNIEYAPGFSRSGAAISIFGIFKDGRMSSDSWVDLGPKITASLAGGPCAIAYSDDLIKTNPGLSSAVDDYVRDNGPTDDILDRFGPLARGNAIMTITVAGQIGKPTAGTATEAPKPSSGPPSRRGGGSRRGRRSQTPPAERSNAKERNALEVSATLFSVALHRSVAVVHMTYSGVSADEGLRKFSEKLATAIPGSACTGWNWSVPVDEDAIRKMEE